MFLSESFDGNSMPEGWSKTGAGTNNWSVSSTNNAGGTANEMHLTWSPQFNGTSRLVTPALNLTGVDTVIVSFKHALDNYSGSHTLGIATSSDGGTTWNSVWSQSYSSSNSWSVSKEISTADMGQENVKFCIYYTGNSYNMNDWFFDDVKIFTMEELDLGIDAVKTSEIIAQGNLPVGITVMNYGTTPITEVVATYEIEGKAPVTETFNVSIASLTSYNLNFLTPTMLIPGNYNINVTINSVNGVSDNYADNNTKTKTVSVAMTSADRIPMIEHFSASTCGPCVAPNTMMNNFCNNNAGNFTYTKYQMNWPGNGDPYYTQEGGVRRQYYGINSVPTGFMDAEPLSFSSLAAVQNKLNMHSSVGAFVDVRGAFTVEGNVINVKADIMPYVNMTAHLFVSVNEKVTTGNVGTNGETSFHHIFMKMLTSAQGNEMNLVAGELQHFEFTQNMSATHVEEMSDLEVSIWVQNLGTKEIFNSHFAYEYTGYLPPVGNLTLTENEGGDVNTLLASWTAPEVDTTFTYNVYVNGELVEENYTETNYTFPAEIGGYYAIGVQVQYPETTSVTSAAGIQKTLGVGESEVQSIGVYPNPVKGTLNIQSDNVQMVEIYNMQGQLVKMQGNSSTISMSDLASGLYMVRIQTAEGVYTQKVVKE